MNNIVKTQQQLAARNSIQALEDLIMSLPEEDQVDPDKLTDHYFAPGIYARMLFVPAGTAVVGKIHKHETMNIVCKGKISVLTEDGSITIEGPCILNSTPGIKKVGYAIEDTWWINVHATEEKDLSNIENEFIAKDYDEIEYQEE